MAATGPDGDELEDFETFLEPEFGVVQFANDLLLATNQRSGSEVDVLTPLKKLKFDLDECDKRMALIAGTNYESMVAKFAELERLKVLVDEKMTPLVGRVENSFRRIKTEVMEPYEDLVKMNNALKRIHLTVELLRGTSYFIFLVQQLEEAERIFDSSERESLKLGDVIRLSKLHNQIATFFRNEKSSSKNEKVSSTSLLTIKLVRDFEPIATTRRHSLLNEYVATVSNAFSHSSSFAVTNDTLRHTLLALYILDEEEYFVVINKVGLGRQVQLSHNQLSKSLQSPRNFTTILVKEKEASYDTLDKLEQILKSCEISNLKPEQKKSKNLLDETLSHYNAPNLGRIYWPTLTIKFKKSVAATMARGGPIAKSLRVYYDGIRTSVTDNFANTYEKDLLVEAVDLIRSNSWGKPIPYPKIFGELVERDGTLLWECSDAEKIESKFIARDLSLDVTLCESDSRKLVNLKLLRDLDEELKRLNNQVKGGEELERAKVRVREKICEITKTSDDSMNSETDKEMIPEIVSEAENFESLVLKIASRGPDYLLYCQIQHRDSFVQLFTSVLSLRQPFNQQPQQVDDLVIQFNGELYNEASLSANDTSYLSEVINQSIERLGRHEGILYALITLRGEFAFNIVDKQGAKVYFGRDFIGRRSLLYHVDQVERKFWVTLVPSSTKPGYTECEGNKIYVFDYLEFDLSTFTYTSLRTRCSMGGFSEAREVQLALADLARVEEKVGLLYQYLSKACWLRQSTIKPWHPESNVLSFAVLFSGGIDCTVLAALLSENVTNVQKTNIDLISVGFDNTRTNTRASDTPDRKLGHKSWFHLAKKFNNQMVSLRFIEIDVTYKEWLAHKKRVQKLMYPCNTEMDLSIAIAFYFASGCKNGRLKTLELDSVSWPEFIANEQDYVTIKHNYTSSSRVLFSGLGADELMAGYSRHEAIFSSIYDPEAPDYQDLLQAKYQELNQSLKHDIDVIHTRNLGRDDRVMSSWGKELRYPYLDEELVKFVSQEIEPNLKLQCRWELTKSKNHGMKLKLSFVRKWILRELAAQLGLDWVKDEPKRAIQFGAKSAKMEIGQSKVKGTDNL